MRPFWFCILCFLSPALLGADTPTLFEAVAGKVSTTFESMPVKDVVKETHISVNLEAVTAETSRFRFQLFDGQAYTAIRTRATQRLDGRLAWYGQIFSEHQDDKDALGYLSFSIFNEQLSGTLQVNGVQFVIVPGSEGFQRLAQVESSGPRCLADEYGFGETTKPQKTREQREEGEKAARIDVMVLYTQELAQTPTIEMNTQAYINEVVDQANDVFANSDIMIRYNLVHAAPISLSFDEIEDQFNLPPNSSITPVEIARDWMNGEPIELKNLRNQYGADMVTLYIPEVDQFPCGVANLPRLKDGEEQIRIKLPSLQFEPFDQRAFNAIAIGCGQADFTFAHELGHNYGMHHDVFSLPTGNSLIQPFARGYVFQYLDPKGNSVTAATVMGCSYNGGSVGQAVCRRIPHFSNPMVDFNNVPTGIAANPPAEVGRDNARFAAERASMYANFRPGGGDAPPIVTITAPANGATITAGQDFQLIGSAIDVEDGNLTANLIWSSDLEPIAATGSPATIQLNNQGDHLLTAMVTDSAGSMVSASVLITVVEPGPNPEVAFVASYKPSEFGPRTTFSSMSNNPASFNYFFDPSLGTFEERPGGACQNGPENPTYFKVKVDSNVTIDSCTFQASWDSEPIPCNQDVLDAVNNSDWVTLNTDNYLFDLVACETKQPLEAHALPFVPHWFQVNLVSGNTTFERRLNFRKGTEAWNVRLEASYLPAPGAQRVEYESGQALPPENLAYFYNQNLGHFEQRPGAPCNTGQNNSTYFTLSLESERPIDSCSFQASWDSQALACNPAVRDVLNAGTPIVINTDNFRYNPATCQLFNPYQAHVFSGVNHWMRATFFINGRAYERRVNFVKQ